MDQIWHRSGVEPRPGVDWAERATYGVIVALGALLFWLSHSHPSLMPMWAPWEFAPLQYLAITIAFYWFWRGFTLAPSDHDRLQEVAGGNPRLADRSARARPSIWRCISFCLGLGLIYVVLQTRVEYWSQHMFFLNRIQHVVMHHLGPFLIALAWPGAMLKRGMPRRLVPLIESHALTAVIRTLQRPWLAAFLFVGLFYLWLIPPIHFRAMIDGQLYALMNWSMVLDGILFWCLVLDPRPKPPARVSYGVRIALAFGVMFPQIVCGAVISFAPTDLYPYYDLCGRLFPSIGALADQQIGGIVSWIPPGMMSVVGVLLVLNFFRLHEEATETPDETSRSMAALSSSWTGR